LPLTRDSAAGVAKCRTQHGGILAFAVAAARLLRVLIVVALRPGRALRERMRATMAIGRFFRRWAQAVAPPLVFLALTGYFVWSGMQGERGTVATAQREKDLAAAQDELRRANAELAIWERRVASLRNNRLDKDALDERVRAMLNLSDPADIVVPYDNGQKLF
jgi:cell division protein FtsB